MGMAASQARLLTVTARIHDVEYQAQSIQNAKLQLATQEDAVYQKYLDALDATTMTYKTDDGYITATFNNLCGFGNVTNDKYALRDSKGRLIVEPELYEGYQSYKHSGYEDSAYRFALYMLGMNGASEREYIEIAENAYTKLTENGDNEKLVTARNALLGFLQEFDSDVDSIYDTTVIAAYEGDDKPEKLSEYKKLLANYEYQLYSVAEYTNDENEVFSGAELIFSEATNIIPGSPDFDEEKYYYYISKYQQIKQCGGCISITNSDFVGALGNGDPANDSEWLKEMVESGKITVETVTMKGGQVSMNGTSPSSDTNLGFTPTTDIDKRELSKVEAEYEQALKKIDKKEQAYDMTLSKLETQRTALTQEYDSLKKVISDNIERTFGIFS